MVYLEYLQNHQIHFPRILELFKRRNWLAINDDVDNDHKYENYKTKIVKR